MDESDSHRDRQEKKEEDLTLEEELPVHASHDWVVQAEDEDSASAPDGEAAEADSEIVRVIDDDIVPDHDQRRAEFATPALSTGTADISSQEESLDDRVGGDESAIERAAWEAQGEDEIPDGISHVYEGEESSVYEGETYRNTIDQDDFSTPGVDVERDRVAGAEEGDQVLANHFERRSQYQT